MKHVLIPYSGGLDSTYLIWKNLKEGNRVTTVYFEISNNSSKVTLEKIHRTKILDILEKDYYSMLDDSYFTYKVEAGNVVNNYSLIQVPIWMLGAFMASNDKFDEVQMGYVMNDDALSYLEEIKALYEAYQPFSNDKLPLMTFPIIKQGKEQMLNELPEEIVKYVYSCENPYIIKDNKDQIVYRYCSSCVPCNKYYEKLKYNNYAFIFSGEYERTYNKNTKEFTSTYKPNKKTFSSLNNIFLDDTQQEEYKTLSLSDNTLSQLISNELELSKAVDTIPVPLTTLEHILINPSSLTVSEEQKIKTFRRTFKFEDSKQLCLFTWSQMRDMEDMEVQKELIEVEDCKVEDKL